MLSGFHRRSFSGHRGHPKQRSRRSGRIGRRRGWTRGSPCSSSKTAAWTRLVDFYAFDNSVVHRRRPDRRWRHQRRRPCRPGCDGGGARRRTASRGLQRRDRWPPASNARLFNDFFAFDPSLRTGEYAAVGDLNADGYDDIILTADVGGSSRTIAYSGYELSTTPNRQPGKPALAPGESCTPFRAILRPDAASDGQGFERGRQEIELIFYDGGPGERTAQ